LLDTDNSGALSKEEVKQLAVIQLGTQIVGTRFPNRRQLVEDDVLDDFFSKVIHVCMLARVPSMVTDCAHFLPMPSLFTFEVDVNQDGKVTLYEYIRCVYDKEMCKEGDCSALKSPISPISSTICDDIVIKKDSGGGEGPGGRFISAWRHILVRFGTEGVVHGIDTDWLNDGPNDGRCVSSQAQVLRVGSWKQSEEPGEVVVTWAANWEIPQGWRGDWTPDNSKVRYKVA